MQVEEKSIPREEKFGQRHGSMKHWVEEGETRHRWVFLPGKAQCMEAC